MVLEIGKSKSVVPASGEGLTPYLPLAEGGRARKQEIKGAREG
jgi:hypothetical protein